MPFAYYQNLSAAKKRIYRRSDAIDRIPLKSPVSINPVILKLKKSLEESKSREVARHATETCRLVCQSLDIEAPVVKIRARRPSRSGEELQGLYEPAEGKRPVITVWMKTAAKRQVVAFKSFIRTVLHELCHHIDYRYFGLEDSFHTQGFFKRESFLYRQIVPKELQKKEPGKKKAAGKKQKKKQKKKREKEKKRKKKPKAKGSEQLEFF
jgi:hypothetical protein